MPADMPLATFALIIITVVTSVIGFGSLSVFERFKFNTQAILKQKEVIRLLSAGFLHADYGHLLFNMFSFYSFASGIEELYGMETVLLIYFSSLLGGNLLALLIHKKHPQYSAIGASGAVCGIIFASVFLTPGGSVIILFFPVPIPAYIYAVLYILFSIFGIKSQRDNIGHEAHLGGSVTGVVISAVLYSAMVEQNIVLFFIILTISSAFIIYSIINPVSLTSKINFGRPSATKTVKTVLPKSSLSEKASREKLHQELQDMLKNHTDKNDRSDDG